MAMSVESVAQISNQEILNVLPENTRQFATTEGKLYWTAHFCFARTLAFSYRTFKPPFVN